MSQKSGKDHGRFIPTLTEVIEDADLLNQLGHGETPQPGLATDCEPLMKGGSEVSAKTSAEQNMQEKKPSALFQRRSLLSKTPAANASVEKEPAASSMQKPAPEMVTSGSVFVGQPYQSRPTDSESAAQQPLDDSSLPHDEELLRESQGMFSSLSRSPAAAPDSLRPSDLMLVALSERIAGKARLRMEKNIETHIQEQIFPLLDQFSAQLVAHIQDDLVKIMRESIAEATREELDWLRQKGNKGRA